MLRILQPLSSSGNHIRFQGEQSLTNQPKMLSPPKQKQLPHDRNRSCSLSSSCLAQWEPNCPLKWLALPGPHRTSPKIPILPWSGSLTMPAMHTPTLAFEKPQISVTSLHMYLEPLLFHSVTILAIFSCPSPLLIFLIAIMGLTKIAFLGPLQQITVKNWQSQDCLPPKFYVPLIKFSISLLSVSS